MNRRPTTVPSASSSHARSEAPARLHGSWLVAARVAWVAIAGLALGVLIVAQPVNFQAARTILSPETQVPGQLTPEDVRLLRQWGLSLDCYAVYQTAMGLCFALVFMATGALLFWRRSDDPIVLFVSLWFVLFVLTGSPLLDPLIRLYPAWQLPVRFLQGAGIGCFPIFTFLFPDGRFVPRWTRVLTIAWVVWIVISPFTPFVIADFAGASTLWFGVLVPGGMGIGIVAQVYRYLRVSSRLERQQTKWVLFGFGVLAVGFVVYSLLPLMIPTVAEPGLARVLYLNFSETFFLVLPFCLFPVCIGIAILRYRLWDIDHLINRTLVYATLTGSLALVYVASVALLQQLVRVLTNQRTDQLAVVVSTLAIAALFQPLRRRIQGIIDRRFYRRKYDAAKTLRAFSSQLRHEVDLNTLSSDLVAVVETTLQAEQVSLWVRPTK